MIPEEDTSKPYLKLCQLLNQSNTEVFYQEDCEGNVVVGEATFPVTLQCEIINFVSEDAFRTRGAITAFESVNVTLNSEVPEGTTVRQAVYEKLKLTYPTLVI